MTSVQEIEHLAAELANALEKVESPQDSTEAQVIARALAIVQMGVEDELSARLAEWTLRNGPVYLNADHEQAYGHWEKKTTMIGDEGAMWAFLVEQGKDIDHYKRPDLMTLKGLMAGEEPIEGLEQFIGSDTTYTFGFKKNLVKKPRVAAGSKETAQAPTKAKPRYGLGVQGVVSRARVVQFIPGDVPPLPAKAVVAPASVMPPVRVNAKA